MGNSTIPSYSYESQAGPFWTFAANPGDVIEPGDLLYFDTGTYTARPLTTASSQSADFCGIATGAYPVSSNIDNGQSPAAASPSITASLGGVHRAQFDTSGDTMNFGIAVYAGADQRHITTTQPGSAPIIGYIWDYQGSTTAVSGTGAEQPQWRPLIQWPSPYLAVR